MHWLVIPFQQLPFRGVLLRGAPYRASLYWGSATEFAGLKPLPPSNTHQPSAAVAKKWGKFPDPSHSGVFGDMLSMLSMLFQPLWK